MLALCLSAPAYAYLDPGTGSIILQGVLASIAVVVGVVRAYWFRLKAFFFRQPSVAADASTPDSQPTESEPGGSV